MAVASCHMTTDLLHGCGQDNVKFESSDHGKSILAGLRHLRQMQLLFDVILVAENKEFPAHRVVLASCSDYFRAMFTDGLKECSQSRITLKGLTASSIAHLLDFAYNSTINIDSDNVVDVLSGATYVQILPVITACENYLRDHLSHDNCISTAEVADMFSLRHLQQHTFSFICKNWSVVVTSGDFCQLPAQFLINLLSSGYPVDCTEYNVLLSLFYWFAMRPTERINDIMNIVNCIMIESISDENLAELFSSDAWMKFSKAFPGFANYFSSLNILRKCDINSSCVDESENIFSLDSTGEKRCVSHFGGKKNSKASCADNHPQGLPNLRGFQPTIVVAGGFHKEAGITNNLMYLDPGSGQLKYLSKIPHLDQINFGLTVFQNELYVVGGSFLEGMEETAHPFGYKFNPVTSEWTSIAPMLEERSRFLLCATEDRIYAVGGDPYASGIECVLEDVGEESMCEVYDPEKNEWRSIAPLPGSRSQAAGAAFGRYVAVSGGIQESTEHVYSDFYLYDPCTDSWEKKKDLICPRADHSMFVWEGSLYVIGGWKLDPVTHKRVMVGSIDRYDFDSNSWEVIGALNFSRTFGTYTLANDSVYAVGGWTDGNNLQKCFTIDRFDLECKTWVCGREQKLALWEHGACSLFLPKFVPSPCRS